MTDLPEKFIIFDTEYTAWPGSMERKWSGPNEHKEIVQIAAIKVSAGKLKELDSFSLIIRPAINPELSSFFTNLTGLTQEKINQEGIDFKTAINRFVAWSENLPLYSFGRDGNVLEKNCELLGITFPFDRERFHDIRDYFKKHGIAAENYHSGTIITAFGKKTKRRGHDAVNDARTILDGLRELRKNQK